MIRCIIIDDEPLAQEILEAHISQNTNLELVKKCSNAIEAFNVLHTQPLDLMFVDIRMPAINGVDFIKSLKNPPAVIFTTAFPNHAVTGFELEAVDYLLKPITLDRFNKSINKLLKNHVSEKPAIKTYTYFKVSGKLVKVFHDQLLYAQSVKDYISIKTQHGSYLVYMTMTFLAQLLPSHLFIRIHRSYLVNITAISKAGRRHIQVGDDEIPIGNNYRSNVLQQLNR